MTGDRRGDWTRRVEDETRDLHRFFEEWFAGAVPRNEVTFARLTHALAPEFELITPDGRLVPRELLLRGLEDSHAKFERGGPTFEVEVRDVRAREAGDGLFLAVYEEWHHSEHESVGRLSTALLRVAPGAPNGLAWLHVHETWLPEDELERA